MALETTVVATVVTLTANPAVSFGNGEPQFTKSSGPMPAAAEPELAEKSLPFPEQYVLLQAVPAAEREAELKEKAVAAPATKAAASDIRLVKAASSQLSREFPQKSRRKVVKELLDGLLKEKREREARNLNHWPEYGPKYLARLAAQWKVDEAERLDQVGQFIAANHAPAVEFARRITRDRDMAEMAVRQTYLELLKGQTEIATFYHALKMNARNVLEKRATEVSRFGALDGIASSVRMSRSLSPDFSMGDDEVDIDFPSSHLEDQDPLDILIARQEQRETNDELDYGIRVVRCKGNRWATKKKWWKTSAIAKLERQLRGPISGGRRNRK